MKVAVIGAGGFVGARVVQILAAKPEVLGILAVDRVPMPDMAKTTNKVGDFSDAAIQAEILTCDAVIFLVAILGGAAEADHALARQVNLDATMDLIDALKEAAPRTRFVNASTVAVYGSRVPDPVTDDTPLAPELIYGTQKTMIEVLLSNYARRGWLDAVSLRPAGVMARDGADKALKSAFMSRLFYAVKRSEDITLPVAEDSTSWMASLESVAQNFVHAALLPDLGAQRALTLPALRIRFGDLVTALHHRFPESGAKVSFAPDPDVIALFGSHPNLTTQTADALGFDRDTDPATLVARVFA